MRIVKKSNGEEMITTEDGPRPKAGVPGPFDEMISTGNIDQVKAKRAAAAAAEKPSAEKEAAKNEK